MNALLAKTANVSMLALAAMPLIAIGIARAEPATVRLSDLNMSRPADVRTFDARVERAANKVCADVVDARQLGRFEACRQAGHAEAKDKLGHARTLARAASPTAG
ncbi:MAG TPA: UrcA family protein [Caulobacteraceae bacterium]